LTLELPTKDGLRLPRNFSNELGDEGLIVGEGLKSLLVGLDLREVHIELGDSHLTAPR
jgi:hypothetical protein